MFVLLSVLACHALSRPGQQSAASHPLGRMLDSTIVAVATQAVSEAPRIARVWPGFFASPTFAIYKQGEYVLLHTASSPPPSFTPVESARVPSVLAQHTYIYRGDWQGLHGGVLPIDPNAQVLAMAVEFDTRRPSGDLEFLLHENFHGWQARNLEGFFSAIPQSVPDSIPLPPSFITALKAERDLLVAALASVTPAQLRLHVDAYLAARQQRSARTPALIARIECRQERLEGTAEFVGLAGALEATQHSREHMADSLQARLNRWMVLETTQREVLIYGAYPVGATETFLLERLGSDWRSAFDRGECLHELLAKALGRS